jgi:hypothetical protein
MSDTRVLFVTWRPAVRCAGFCCVDSIVAIHVMQPEHKDAAARIAERFRRSRKPVSVAFDSAYAAARELAEYTVMSLAARHMAAILLREGSARKIAAAVRVVEWVQPVVTASDGTAVLATAYMPFAVAVYEVPDVRDLLSLSHRRDAITLYFALRGPLYVFRGHVRKEVLDDLAAQQLLDRLADAVLQLAPAVHTLQEALIECGVARPAGYVYHAVLPRETWQRIHDVAVRSGLKDEIRRAVETVS